MRYAPLMLAVLLIGCSSEPTDDPSPEPARTETSAAPKATPNGSELDAAPKASDQPVATAPAPSTGPQAEAVLNGKQVDAFIKRIAPRMGHGGLSEADTKEFTDMIKAIPVGESKSGGLHIDHEGRHVDLNLTVDRTAEDKYSVKLSGSDQAAVESLGKDLKTVK